MSIKLQRRKDVPFILLGYTAFAILATGFSVAVTVNESLRMATVPYTGWVGVFPYSMTIYFAIVGCYYHCPPATQAVQSFLKMMIVCGVLDFVFYCAGCLFGVPNFQNPYLTYSLWRLLITPALPIVWWALLTYETSWIPVSRLPDADVATNNPMDRSGGSAAS